MILRSAALLVAGLALCAQGPGALEEAYLKREVRIPMRDGVELFTAIYTPRHPDGKLPILLHRTCYGIGPYGPSAYPQTLGPSELFAREGYIFAYQDVRGRMMSGGTFQEMTPHLDGRGVDEATDAFDTIQWLLDHVPGHNGRVGAWGISYPGFYAASALVRAHPALRAVSPQAPITDLFNGDDDHHNGALFLSQAFWFAAAFGKPRPEPTSTWDWNPGFSPGHDDGYRFFLELGALRNADARYLKGRIESWTGLMAHPLRDAYWSARDLRPHLRDIHPAVLTVGGWFDAEDCFGALQTHQRIQQSGPGGENLLVMGPWSHGAWAFDRGERLGDLSFGQPTGTYYREQVEAPFFRHHLKDGPDPKLPKALVFETGANLWRSFDAWPPRKARPTRLYLAPGGHLASGPPPGENPPDTFLSDPARPVPYTSGTELQVSPDYMVGDQRFAARRPDVLVYQTPVLGRDLTVAGPIRVHLQASTTGTDADWVVKVIDVHPDDANPLDALAGAQQLVRGEVLRGKFRNHFEAPEPFVPDQPTLVAFSLNDICHRFRAGHRIMVQIQGSWFPLVDRNPQVFMDINQARDEDFRKAEQRIFHTPALPSWLELPELRSAD